MKRQFSSRILRFGASLIMCGLLANGLPLRAQEFGVATSGTVSVGPGSPGGFGLVINGLDVGTILLKTCDLDQDGKVTSPELKDVTLACFKLWDTNSNGIMSAEELSTGLKQLFPPPPDGARQHFIHRLQIEGPPNDLPPPKLRAFHHMLVTPDGQVARHLLSGADSDKDGSLTVDEVSVFLFDKSFSQWDRDGNASLDAQELNAAFAQLAKPD